MGRYICGPVLIRLPNRPAIVAGEVFEHDYTPAEERVLLQSGAATLAPEPPTVPSPAGVDRADAPSDVAAARTVKE